jgi:hypothetical protein
MSSSHSNDTVYFGFAHAINSAKQLCIAGNPITATQFGRIVTVRCRCGMEFSTEIKTKVYIGKNQTFVHNPSLSRLFTSKHEEIICDFMEFHPLPSTYKSYVCEPIKYSKNPQTNTNTTTDTTDTRNTSLCDVFFYV